MLRDRDLILQLWVQWESPDTPLVVGECNPCPSHGQVPQSNGTVMATSDHLLGKKSCQNAVPNSKAMSWINTDYICTCRTGTYNLILNTGFQTISFKKNGACTSTVWYPSFQNKHAIQIIKPLYFSIFFLPRSNVAECEY